MLWLMNGPPEQEPLGVQLTRTARTVNRAFDETLAAQDGSLGTWLVLVSLQGRAHGAQRELAAAVGVEGPTLTHHLNRMERAGLVTRRRDPENRRVHLVEPTDEGQALFRRLLGDVIAFDARLRAGFDDHEVEQLRGFLERLRANVAPADATATDATPAPAASERTEDHEATEASEASEATERSEATDSDEEGMVP
jgi:MarR family transcriptional regulator, transcriptional regulator for hemolysin